jgi:hypothetical protein
MNTRHCIRLAIRWTAVGGGLAAACYATYAGLTWYGYGRVRLTRKGEDADMLLEQFMPEYEAARRHHARVDAPAEITLAAAAETDLRQSAVVRWIFRGRELILGSQPEETPGPGGLVAWAKALGWGVLAEIPGREIVFGAVTQPWRADVLLRAIPPDQFVAFHDPGYAKIVWTLRADPAGSNQSVFRTETRVATTDPRARAIFRRYWSFFSPGMVLIRRMSLGLLKAEAERRWWETTHAAC